jgi:hypothetical protein
MKWSEEEEAILKGLEEYGHQYASASELHHARFLIQEGLVELWTTMGGFTAWRITEKGINRP